MIKRHIFSTSTTVVNDRLDCQRSNNNAVR